jgi:5-hmdU DNA kinase-like protein
MNSFPFREDSWTMETFWTFVYERQMVYHRRFELNQTPPWTEDQVLRDYHFCNVYRELDRGTLFLTEKILPACKSDYDAAWNILIYRYFNQISTFEYLARITGYFPWTEHWDYKSQAAALRSHEGRGHKVFTSAFTVTGVRFGGFPDKIRNVCYLMEQLQPQIPRLLGKLRPSPSFRDVYYAFLGMDGFGHFLAFQVAVDWAYWDRNIDRNSFAVAGPGCKHGLRWIFPEINGERAFTQGIHYLTNNQRAYFSQYNLEFPYWNNQEIVASDIENCLCEASKYFRLKFHRNWNGTPVRGGGRMRKFDASSRIQPSLI